MLPPESKWVWPHSLNGVGLIKRLIVRNGSCLMYGWWTIVSSRGECNHDIQFSFSPCTLCPCVHWVQAMQWKSCSVSYDNTPCCCTEACILLHILLHHICALSPSRFWLAAMQANMHQDRKKNQANFDWLQGAGVRLLRSVIPSLQNNEAQRLFWPLRQLERFSASFSILAGSYHISLSGD